MSHHLTRPAPAPVALSLLGAVFGADTIAATLDGRLPFDRGVALCRSSCVAASSAELG
ncbi:MAG: hypothetical protein ACREPA_12735 [Candidatus Dormibacteraceae bacterium]